MKIAFDAQLLFENKKTGIGWTVKKIIDNMDYHAMKHVQLNYFAFRNKESKRKIIRKYTEQGYLAKECGWIPLSIYRKISSYISFPYHLVMGRDCEITQFFNFVIPPGVRGKKAVYIYDMVYKACPETMEEENRRYLERNVENSCRCADIIITISDFSKNEILKYLDIEEKKIHVVPCGVDLETFNCDITSGSVTAVREKYSIPSSYYLYLGTLEPRKNIPAIVEAYKILRNQLMEETPYLVIAGKKGWDYETIFSLVKQYQLEEQVIFTGYITEEDKKSLLKGALSFVFPSLYEGFGLPPLEAMACGTPVIVSDRASLPEVVGNAGLLIDPEDHEGLATAMEKVFSDMDYRKELSQKGIEQAQKFSWKETARKLWNVYEQELSV